MTHKILFTILSLCSLSALCSSNDAFKKMNKKFQEEDVPKMERELYDLAIKTTSNRSRKHMNKLRGTGEEKEMQTPIALQIPGLWEHACKTKFPAERFERTVKDPKEYFKLLIYSTCGLC